LTIELPDTAIIIKVFVVISVALAMDDDLFCGFRCPCKETLRMPEMMFAFLLVFGFLIVRDQPIADQTPFHLSTVLVQFAWSPSLLALTILFKEAVLPPTSAPYSGNFQGPRVNVIYIQKNVNIFQPL